MATIVATPANLIRGYTFDLFIDRSAAVYDGTTTVNLGAGITVNTIKVISTTALEVNITVSAGATLGARSYTTTTGGTVDTGSVNVRDSIGTITLKGGFQYTILSRGHDFRRTPGIMIRDVLNNQPNTCTFTIDGTSNQPKVGEKITVTDAFDGNRLLFAGNVQSADSAYEELKTNLVWVVTCIDFTWLFNRKRPQGSYTLVSASQIVVDLVTRFAPGFTTEYVQTTLPKVTVTFDGSSDLATCFNQIAEAIGGGHWYIDYLQRVHFFRTKSVNSIYNRVPPGGDGGSEGGVSFPAGAPQTAVTIAQGANFSGGTFTEPYQFQLAVAFVYGNGVESALGPWSDCYFQTQTGTEVISAIPVGTTVGGVACIKRRIYALNSFNVGVQRYVEIQDNTTTSINWGFYLSGGNNIPPAGSPGTTIANTVPLPLIPWVAPPAGPSQILGVAESPIVGPGYTSTAGYTDNSIPPIGPWPSSTLIVGGMGGGQIRSLSFRQCFLYRNGTVSWPSPQSAPLPISDLRKVALQGLEIGRAIGSVDVVARLIYCAQVSGGGYARTLSAIVAELQQAWTAQTLVQLYSGLITAANAALLQALSTGIPTTYSTLSAVIGSYYVDALLSGGVNNSWTTGVLNSPCAVIPNNTDTTYTIEIAQTPYHAYRMPWNVKNTGTGGTGGGGGDDFDSDGPDLESTLPQPEVIDDNSTTLLKDPPFLKAIDLSQVRNRVFVRGAGSYLTAGAKQGDTGLVVAECSFYDTAGGTVYLNGVQLAYTGLTAPSGPGTIILLAALNIPASTGDAVFLFIAVEDLESQKALARVELDKDGAKTDGIHEYMIVDSQLTRPNQLYKRAYAELTMFAWPLVTITYGTRDPNTRSGALVTVDLSGPWCQGTFLIQDVTIDQVRDDTDAISPRYRVSATSARYTLNDLLLRVLFSSITNNISIANSTGSGGGGGSNSSIFPSNRTCYAFIQRSGITTPVVQAIGTTQTTTGTPTYDKVEITPFADAQSSIADSSWATLPTLASSGDQTRIQFAPVPADCIENPFDMWFELRTPADLSSIILWVGLASVSTFSTVNSALCALRYNSALDVGWSIILQPEGASHHQTKIYLTGISASTYTVIRVQSARSVPSDYLTQTVTFSVNGVSRKVTMQDTYNPPATGNNSPYDMPTSGAATSNGTGTMVAAVAVSTQANAIRKFNFRRFYCSTY